MTGYTKLYKKFVEGGMPVNKRELLDKFARDGDQRLLLARVLDQ